MLAIKWGDMYVDDATVYVADQDPSVVGDKRTVCTQVWDSPCTWLQSGSVVHGTPGSVQHHVLCHFESDAMQV